MPRSDPSIYCLEAALAAIDLQTCVVHHPSSTRKRPPLPAPQNNSPHREKGTRNNTSSIKLARRRRKTCVALDDSNERPTSHLLRIAPSSEDTTRIPSLVGKPHCKPKYLSRSGCTRSCESPDVRESILRCFCGRTADIAKTNPLPRISDLSGARETSD